jgi:hypothetical protein
VKKNGFAPLLTILIIVVVGVVGYLAYKNSLSKQQQIDINQEQPAMLSAQILSEKKALIGSIDVNDVSKAIILGFASDSEIQSGTSSSSSSPDSFDLPSYKIALTQNETTQLNNYLNKNSTVVDGDATVNNQNWEDFMFTSGADIYTKDGYMCTLSYADSPPLDLECIKVNLLKDNTPSNVEPFMKSLFSDAGINCNNNNCNIRETTDYIPLYKYGRYIETSENIAPNSSTPPKTEVAQLASESAQFLKSVGWAVVEKDNTVDEINGGFPDTLASALIAAENSLFSCTHVIIRRSPVLYGKLQNTLQNWVDCSYTGNLSDIQSKYNPYK